MSGPLSLGKAGLVLTRLPGQSVTIDVNGVQVVVTLEPRGDRTGQRLRFEAPSEAKIVRTELLRRAS